MYFGSRAIGLQWLMVFTFVCPYIPASQTIVQARSSVGVLGKTERKRTDQGKEQQVGSE